MAQGIRAAKLPSPRQTPESQGISGVPRVRARARFSRLGGGQTARSADRVRSGPDQASRATRTASTSRCIWATSSSTESNRSSARIRSTKRTFAVLPVQVAVEVEEVRLEQRALGVLVEGGAAAERDRAAVLDVGRVDVACRRRCRRPAGRRVRAPRRSRSGSRARVPAGHPSRRCPAPRAGAVGARAAAPPPRRRRSRGADGCASTSTACRWRRRRWARARARGPRSRARRPSARGASRCRDAGGRSGSRHRRRRAAPRGPRRAPRGRTPRPARGCAPRRRSGRTSRSTNPVAAMSSSFWSSIVSTFGALSGRTTSAGMTVEGQARGGEAPRVGEVAHEAQHRLVPEVHAVVRPDRHDRARGRRREADEIGDDLHHAAIIRRRPGPRPRPTASARGPDARTRRGDRRPGRRPRRVRRRRPSSAPEVKIAPWRTARACSASTSTRSRSRIAWSGVSSAASGSAAIASRSWASSRVNEPIRRRRRRSRWAGPPSAAPRSAASVRTYVPDEHTTRIRAAGYGPGSKSSTVERLDANPTRRALHLDTRAGELVQSPTTDLERGHHRRNLLDVTDEARRGLLDLGAGQGHRRAVEHVAGGVERARGDAEPDGSPVLLGRALQVLQQSGDAPEPDQQHARRVGIERARVPDAPLPVHLAHARHDVVRRPRRRLVDDDEAVSHHPHGVARCGSGYPSRGHSLGC